MSPAHPARKPLLLVLAVLISLSAAACGSSGSERATASESTSPAEPTTTVAETTTTAEGETPEVEAHDGAVLFESNCARCHGVDGAGTTGPALFDLTATYPFREEIIAIITNGPGSMPAFAETIEPAEIDAITDHVIANFG